MNKQKNEINLTCLIHEYTFVVSLIKSKNKKHNPRLLVPHLFTDKFLIINTSTWTYMFWYLHNYLTSLKQIKSRRLNGHKDINFKEKSLKMSDELTANTRLNKKSKYFTVLDPQSRFIFITSSFTCYISKILVLEFPSFLFNFHLTFLFTFYFTLGNE